MSKMITSPFMIKVKKERIFGICSLPFKKAKSIPLILTHGSGDNSSQYPLVHLSKFFDSQRLFNGQV